MKNNLLYWSRTLQHEIKEILEKLKEISDINPAEDDKNKHELMSLAIDEFESIIDNPDDFKVFDCQKINEDFLIDSGIAAKEDMNTLDFYDFNLPFDSMIFEFNHFIVVGRKNTNFVCKEITDEIAENLKPNHAVTESSLVEDDELYELPNSFSFNLFKKNSLLSTPLNDLLIQGNISPAMTEIAYLGEQSDAYAGHINNEFNNSKDAGKACDNAALMTLGVITLLNEKLASSEKVKKPEALSRKRKKKGKKDIYCDYRVVKLNIGEVKRRAKQAPKRKHESPALHWRIGHKRILHRGSEFEKEIWIEKMLVGDPEKGYIRKHYQLENYQTFA